MFPAFRTWWDRVEFCGKLEIIPLWTRSSVITRTVFVFLLSFPLFSLATPVNPTAGVIRHGTMNYWGDVSLFLLPLTWGQIRRSPNVMSAKDLCFSPLFYKWMEAKVMMKILFFKKKSWIKFQINWGQEVRFSDCLAAGQVGQHMQALLMLLLCYQLL